MCGICGIYNFDAAQVDKNVLQKMTGCMAHRGPDNEGLYVSRNIGLGHRRLAIIDLSTGNQPIYNEDKSMAIVYNGAVYNYIELREELKSLGHRFTTQSDTEVIIHAYEQWGTECQNKLNGMWAFAVWDNNKKELFLSRDRLGGKPLHYAVLGNTFLFGSEIKSILEYGFPRDVDLKLLEIYLLLGFIPAPFSFYKGVHKLMPGHYLIVQNGNIHEHKYWDLPEIDEKNMLTNEHKVYEKFEYLLRDSIRIRMRSDVPYGVFLSGGLDSPSIVALMSEISSLPIETFTIGFNEKEYDERIPARKVAAKFKTNHHENIVSSDSFEDAVKKVIFHYDEPFGDSSAIPTGYVSKYARQKVKMVLSGDGGDEVLSGYTIYQGEKFASQYQELPQQLRVLMPKLLSMFAWFMRGNPRYKLNRLIDVCKSSSYNFNRRMIEKNSWIEADLAKSLLGEENSYIKIEDFLSDLMSKCSYNDTFYKVMYFQFKLTLPDNMLVKTDRMSMAYSLEVRIPFLDHRLVEFMVGVDKKVKMKGYERKSVLRNTVGVKLPQELLRTPKMGFDVPVREWFKEKTFENYLNNFSGLSHYCAKPAIMKQIIDANISGEKDYGNFIWMLFVLDKWLQN